MPEEETAEAAERQDGRTAATAQPPDRPAADLVGVAIGSLATGAAAGGAAVTLGVLLFRDQLRQSLPLVLFSGVVASAATAWLMAAPLAHETWRRGVTAAVAVFAGTMLAFLSAPIDRLAGTFGLSLYALGLAAAAVFGARYTRERARA